MSDSKKILTPKLSFQKGSLHPINQVKDHIVDFLISKGFTHTEGPEVETEKYNFDMLNIKESHPARQMHDTFYVNNKSFVS